MDIALTAHIPDTTELALRRLDAYEWLHLFLRTGNDKHLSRFVRLVGEGGTFVSDFWFASDGDEHRDCLRPRCWRCRQRKPVSAFRVDRHALHGRSPWCKSCELERADNPIGRQWHRNPTGVKRKVIPIEEPIVYFKECECCGKRYETVHHNQRYCSRSCRWAVNKRNHRARKAA